jgi:methylenetetrahydrofolate dehydrogenase (NADP+)/methenyltetrahydrofolate cyclohydrolase
VAAELRAEIRARVERLATAGITPGLAVILLGDDPASRSYVRGKRKAAAELGIAALDHDLPAATTEAGLLGLIARLNSAPAVHGILVQLPLPAHVREDAVIEAIHPDKDVDGFHPVNAGRLVLGQPGFVPCTPAGILELLVRSSVPLAGRHAVIVGRSRIVGRPLSILLSQKGPRGDATVTVCHSRTPDLAAHCRRADILVAALGRPRAITADMVKEGAAVIDVGVNRVGTEAGGKAVLAGDVDFAPVAERAAFLTPVPGGVGPMTITMLMHNTVLAAEQTREQTRDGG